MTRTQVLRREDPVRPSPAVHEILNSSLYGPVADLLERPAKNIRALLVRAGSLSAGGTDAPLGLSEALEAIHAGSLIIDDIQDGSLERRGSPSLHEKYGVPLALNAGNFLYFQPFALIASMSLPPLIELRLYRECHVAMLNAHIGQAIDLGADITAITDFESVCTNSSRLKTGALTSLALACGAIVAGADDALVAQVRAFGEKFGIALQRYDDIGNLKLDGAKRFEDVVLARPSWAWALAERLGPRAARAFHRAARELPDTVAIEAWFTKHDFFAFARRENDAYLNDVMLEAPSRARTELSELATTLRRSYGG